VKVVIAPDSFKESLPAADVAAAIAAGVLQACPDARVDLCPMADGGEGTVAAMVAATGGRYVTADVFGPLGAPLRAQFGLLGRPAGAGLPGEVGLSGAVGELAGEGAAAGGATTAVIEMAAASGLALVPEGRRDPRQTTSYGTGLLLLAALDAGARDIVVGIGGSATVDGGAGCAQALGVAFTDAAGAPCVCGLAGGGLTDIADFDLAARDARVAQARIRVACDVTNPLLGPAGAARVYGPQKGATPEVVEILEANLTHLAGLIRGAGAAGGLGAGLIAFAGASLCRGVQLVAEAVRLRERLVGADLCLTGEGRLDGQTAHGKAAFGVAEVARAAGVPCVCIPGAAAADAPTGAFAAVHPLVAGEVTMRLALQTPATFLKRRAAEAVRALVG